VLFFMARLVSPKPKTIAELLQPASMASWLQPAATAPRVQPAASTARVQPAAPAARVQPAATARQIQAAGPDAGLSAEMREAIAKGVPRINIPGTPEHAAELARGAAPAGVPAATPPAAPTAPAAPMAPAAAALQAPEAPNYEELIRRAIELSQEATRPGREMLEAGIPGISERFAEERGRLGREIDPLKERYANLLSEITRREKVETTAQTLATSRELGRRGVLPTSGLGERELLEAVSPIRERYAGLSAETGLAQQEGIRAISEAIAALPGQETEAIQNVRNAIAQLQMGAGQTGLTAGLDIYGTQMAERGAALDRTLRERAQALSERAFEEVSLPAAARAAAPAAPKTPSWEAFTTPGGLIDWLTKGTKPPAGYIPYTGEEAGNWQLITTEEGYPLGQRNTKTGEFKPLSEEERAAYAPEETSWWDRLWGG